MKDIQEYVAKRHALDPDERVTEFHKLSRSFGEVDPETKSFRDECIGLGFKVVFRSGLTRAETLEILRSKETQNILASHC